MKLLSQIIKDNQVIKEIKESDRYKYLRVLGSAETKITEIERNIKDRTQ